MKTYTFILLSFFLTNCSSIEKTITLDEIKSHYTELITLDIKTNKAGKSYSYTVNEVFPSGHPFKEFSVKFNLYIDYLLWNYTHINSFEILKKEADPAIASKKYIQLLQNDSLFNANFLPVLYYFLKKKHTVIKDYLPVEKYKVTKNQLITTAANFFYASDVDSVTKRIVWRICVGDNPYHKDSSLKKLPVVEAFSLVSIMNKKHWKSQFHKDFMANIRKIGIEVKEIQSTENKLNIARKRMPEEMAKNKDLEKVLLKEYRKNKEFLPFEIIEN